MKVSYIATKEGDSNALLSSYVQVCTTIFVLGSSIYSFVFVEGCSGQVNVYANSPLS